MEYNHFGGMDGDFHWPSHSTPMHHSYSPTSEDINVTNPATSVPALPSDEYGSREISDHQRPSPPGERNGGAQLEQHKEELWALWQKEKLGDIMKTMKDKHSLQLTLVHHPSCFDFLD
jgi:hypothetical protein